MAPRDPEEHPRAATPLELLFDLCFVVAIAQLAAALHHAIAAGHAAEGVRGFVMVFLAIWWAWMGFTWFASAFDTDDAPYRLKVLVQMAGVLVLAAGVKRAFEEGDFTLITMGYVIMRIGLVALWVRAGRSDASVRGTAFRYAGGIVVLQVFWIGLLRVPANLWIYGWGVLILCELLVPLWAESAAESPWHPHHISERYGLLTIIVIGESVLASTLAIQSAVDLGTIPGRLVQVIISAPVILFAMWWLYFSQPGHEVIGTMRRASSPGPSDTRGDLPLQRMVHPDPAPAERRGLREDISAGHSRRTGNPLDFNAHHGGGRNSRFGHRPRGLVR